MDWKNLPFGYMPTDYNVRCYYRNGRWGELEISSSEFISIHMSATCLHYGQESFEGMKAYLGKDGKIRLFRWKENAGRMKSSAEGIMLAVVPEKLFHEAIVKAVSLNRRFIPPQSFSSFIMFITMFLQPLWIFDLFLTVNPFQPNKVY